MPSFDNSKLYSVTHTEDGIPILREPKLLKVGIGAPKGKACMVWMQADKDKPWRVGVGWKDSSHSMTVYPCATRQEAEDTYAKAAPTAPDCPYPRKLSFFTFTKPNADGSFMPDFAAIEAHGPTPTEIDIVFMTEEPFQGEFAMWSATQLRCHGNGIDAERILEMATAEQAEQAALAKEAGLKMFPLADCCWTRGCPYSKPEMKGSKEYPSPCKPSGDLKFQLARNLRIGGTVYYHTTGFRTISQLFSSITRIRDLAWSLDVRLAGIPLVLKLTPFKTVHNGQSAIQQAVSVEFRADTVEKLRKKMIEQAFTVRASLAPAPKQIEAPAPESAGEGEEDEPTPIAAAIAAEFYSEATEDEPGQTPSDAVKEKTDNGTKELKERLRAAQPGPVAVEKPTAEAVVQSKPEVGKPEVGKPDERPFF